jgi:hypothetical protein
MTEKVTYYAITDDRASLSEPTGVLRRVVHDRGQRDEAFAYDTHHWETTSLLYAYERGTGDEDSELFEITEDEANAIVERIGGTVS